MPWDACGIAVRMALEQPACSRCVLLRYCCATMPHQTLHVLVPMGGAVAGGVGACPHLHLVCGLRQPTSLDHNNAGASTQPGGLPDGFRCMQVGVSGVGHVSAAPAPLLCAVLWSAGVCLGVCFARCQREPASTPAQGHGRCRCWPEPVLSCSAGGGQMLGSCAVQRCRAPVWLETVGAHADAGPLQQHAAARAPHPDIASAAAAV